MAAAAADELEQRIGSPLGTRTGPTGGGATGGTEAVGGSPSVAVDSVLGAGAVRWRAVPVTTFPVGVPSMRARFVCPPEGLGHGLDGLVQEQPVGRGQVQTAGPGVVEGLDQVEAAAPVAGVGLGAVGVDQLGPAAQLPSEVVGAQAVGQAGEGGLVLGHGVGGAGVVVAGEQVGLVGGEATRAEPVGDDR